MTQVRIGIIGLGNMGSHHVSYMNTIAGATLTAVCDADRPRADHLAKSQKLAPFYDYQDLLNSGLVDAIIIATVGSPGTELEFAL